MKRVRNIRSKTIFLSAMMVAWFGMVSVRAATHIAASCSQVDVQNALNQAAAGDTVMIPAGTARWTSSVSWSAPANVTLLGAGNLSVLGGGDATVIVDDFVSGSPLIAITTSPTGTFRLAGITVRGGNGSLKENGVIAIHGLSKKMRVDHIHIDMQSYSVLTSAKPMRLGGWLNGVIDHIVIDLAKQGHIHFSASSYGTGVGSYGDESFAAPTKFGTSDFIFVEDSQFNAVINLGGSVVTDSNAGGRFVLRYNTVMGAGFAQTHPTGGAGRGRGCRAHEVYGNITAPSAGFDPRVDNPPFTFSWMSSGTSMVWGNTSSGTYKNFIYFDSMRKSNATYSQTATPNGWGYSGTEFNGAGSNWDGNTDPISGYPCLDQPGRGQSDLLSGQFPNAINTRTGIISWPNQALEPVREWLNVFNSVKGWGNDSNARTSVPSGAQTRLMANRDYYSQKSSFDGTSGIGVGPRASRPTTCTVGVAYWSTDQGGNWNTSNGTANDGALDICTAPNTWTDAAYTPYIYPHPLIAETDTSGRTYWVSPTGGSTWANARSAVALDGVQACSLNTANANAVAGDTIYMRGGVYNTHIFPARSGTDVSNRISYVAASGEIPVIQNTGVSYATYYHGIALIGRSYIKISGVSVDNPLGIVPAGKDRILMITHGGSYNEIAHCTLNGNGGGTLVIWDGGSAPHPSGTPAMHNWIHHCMFSNMGSLEWSESVGYVNDVGGMQIGVPSYDNESGHNSIENNIFFCGGHHNLETFTKYNVIRNNYFHNEGSMPNHTGHTPIYGADSNGLWGNRNLQIYDGYNEDKFNLLEANRFGHAGPPPDDDGGDGLTVTAPKNIIRYNAIFNSGNNGVLFKTGASSFADHNRFYNNTVYKSGRYHNAGPLWQGASFRWYGSYARVGNVIKNNIFYQNGSLEFLGGSATVNTDNSVTNNWLTTRGDPLFINGDLSQPLNPLLPDMNVSANSGAIDQGVPLTRTIGSGSGSTVLSVQDALYFQDGSWGSDLARVHGDFQADWIAVGTSGHTAQIQSVNYAGNLITLKSPLTWSPGDSVWLYKDSKGRQVLYGITSDLGAYEFISIVPDSDGDGLMDAWEIQYFGSISDSQALPDLDVDGDGMSNLSEQAAGTSPIDSKSRFIIISQSLSEILGFTITWQSVSNKTYMVEGSNTLTNWIPAASVDSTSSSTSWTDSSIIGTRKFYRVKTQ